MNRPPFKPDPDVSGGTIKPGGRRPSGTRLLAWTLVLTLAIGCIGPVLGGLIPELLNGNGREPGAMLDAISPDRAWLIRLAKSLAYALGIGLTGTALAWPGAWLARTRPALAMSLAMVPLLLPPYLASAGLNTLRGPGTLLAGWLADPAVDPHLSVLVGRATAVLGLSLWASALGIVVIGEGVRAIPAQFLDAVALEPASWLERARLRFGLVRRETLRSVGLITLIMLGSAVPLNLAQADTLSVDMWTRLQSSPDRGAAWATAWPVVAIALVGAFVLTRGRRRPVIAGEQSGPGASEARRGRRLGLLALALGVFGLGVVLPIGLFASTIRDTAALHAFWRDGWESVERSSVIALAVTTLTLALALGAWRLRSTSPVGSPGRGRWLLGLFASCALVPGVLVGSSIARCDGSLATLAGGVGARSAMRTIDAMGVPLILAHAARFGVVPLLVAFWLSDAEPQDRRDARRQASGRSLLGWARTELRAGWGALAGAGIGVFLLSLHEIEATVMLDPPGRVRPISQQMLEDLHRLNDDRLAAGVITLVGAGVVVALVAGVLGSRLWSGRQSRTIEGEA